MKHTNFMVELDVLALAPVVALDGSQCDHTLMVQVRSHDLDALAILVDRYQPHMMGLAMKALRDRDAAETAVASAFDTVWHYAARYNPDHHTVSAWLLGLTAWQCGGLAATHAAVQVSQADAQGYTHHSPISDTS